MKKMKVGAGIFGIILIGMVLAGTFLVASAIIKMASVGYIVGYQGLQAEFNSVYYKGYWYDSTHTGPNSQITYWSKQKATAAEFFDRLNLDPDHSTEYLPNLCASQAPVVLDESAEPKVWIWRVKTGEEIQKGENETHTWTTLIEVFKEFQMMRYKAEWSMNLWLSGPAGEAYPDQSRAWRDAQIWIRLVPKDFVYFKDNPEQVFFSPSLIQLKDIDWYSFKESKDQETPDSTISKYQDLIPKAEGETLGIFYSRGGYPVEVERTLISYEGRILDPEIFRDEYWVKISVLEYKPYSWFEWGGLLGWGWKYPSVKLKFLVHIFVVGQWTVRLEKGDIVELKEHETLASPPTIITSFLDAINQWLADPFNKLALAFFFFIVIVLVLLVFTPLGSVLATALGRRIVERKPESRKGAQS